MWTAAARATVVAVSALLAACSTTAGEQGPRSMTALTTPPPATSSATTTARPATTTPSPPTGAPDATSPIGAVVGWIEAGTPMDAASFRTATRGGVTTDLGTDVAFTGPAGTPNCMTDERVDGALACLVDLADPPPRAPDTYGQWKGGWVDYSGTTVDVGSSHGDPGRFGSGVGTELPPGHSVAFGDYRCRADGSDVYCVDYAHRTGVAFSAAGIVGYGCLRPAPPPPGIGRHLAC